jgi:ABC-type transport system involved in cytochrome bd biosynthesis fused ATPase/permease subunit
VIAHRLSTVRDADLIVVVDQGTILEQGRHDDLIAKRGAYFELVKAQLGSGRTIVESAGGATAGATALALRG